MDFDRLDSILKRKHISRRKLARAVGVNENTMSSAFLRKSGFGIEEVIAISNYLDVNPAYLAGLDGESEQSHKQRFTQEIEELIAMYNKWTPFQRETIMNQLRLLDKLLTDQGGAE